MRKALSLRICYYSIGVFDMAFLDRMRNIIMELSETAALKKKVWYLQRQIEALREKVDVLNDQSGNALKTANQARNEALSYYTTNTNIATLSDLRSIEAAQVVAEEVSSIRQRINGGKTRVVFLVPDTSLWDVYAPIYSEMANSVDFHPIVICFLRQDVVADKSESEVIDFFHGIGIDAKIEGYSGLGGFTSIQSYRPDFVFYTLGSAAYPEIYSIEFVSHFCRTCYLSYGFLMVDELDYQFGQSFHSSAWAIFASTPREVQEYELRCKRLSSNVKLVGYPKFDLYRHVVLKKPIRPLIIWAPHWTVGGLYPSLNLGTYDKIYKAMFDLLVSRKDVDFIFKPHPNLKYACSTTGVFSESEFDDYVSSLDALPNVSVWKHGDYFRLFAESTAMITDSVSFLAEYLPTGRPLLFLDRPDRVKMSECGERIIASHYRGYGLVDIDGFLATILSGQDPKFADRERAIAEELYIEKESSASAKIVNALRSAPCV